MGVWGLSPQWGQGRGAKPPWSWKHFSILKLLGCCFPGLFQPNTQVFLAIQVQNHRSLNDAQIRGGGAPLRGGGAELRWALPYIHHCIRFTPCSVLGKGFPGRRIELRLDENWIEIQDGGWWPSWNDGAVARNLCVSWAFLSSARARFTDDVMSCMDTREGKVNIRHIRGTDKNP